jgi:N-acetyl-gamma-glutamyl-phosphate reductase
LNADQIPSRRAGGESGLLRDFRHSRAGALLSAGLVDCDRGIISDSKSGVSGAGKEPTARTHFVSVADNFSAYSVFGHRHTGEILEQLALDSSQLIFTPHLLPIPRGILSTIYVYLKREMTADEIQNCFQGFYKASGGYAFSRHRVCRKSNSPCTPTTATSAFVSRTMAAGWCWFPVSTTC